MKIKPIHQSSCHCGAVQFQLALPNGIEDSRFLIAVCVEGVNPL